jgi:hypothetical protein
MSSTLIAHSPKFQSQLVNLEQLRQVPPPQSLGRNHKPVPHALLVDSIHTEIANRGLTIEREQYALGRKGAALFGVIDLVRYDNDSWAADHVRDGRGLALGFRNATDQSMAIRGVAGSHVFVCDNLALSGETFAFQHKNSRYLDLACAVATGFDRFMQQSRAFDIEVSRLQARELTDMCAKALIYDVFAAGIAPLHLFDDVNRFYFQPDADATDCQPRTAWGVHNAFTRAFRELSPTRLLGASSALSKQFTGVL